MDLLNSSEIFRTYLPVLLLTCIATKFGSSWIDKLYMQEEDSDLLSFPKQIAQRARFRMPLLFVLLAVCIGKAWSVTTGIQLFYFAIAIVLAVCIGKAWSVTTGIQLFYFAIAIVLLVFVTITDFEQYVIFDSMLLPLAVAGFCYTLHIHLPVTEHFAAALGGGLLFLLLAMLTKGAIGGGDIKLIAALGLWLGVRPLITVIAYGFIAGGIAALFLLITKQKQRNSYFAYGPYFAISGMGIMMSWLKMLF